MRKFHLSKKWGAKAPPAPPSPRPLHCFRDVPMEGRKERVLRPQYYQICKKVGRKSAILQECWPQHFLRPFPSFLVTIIGQLVKTYPQTCPQVARQLLGKFRLFSNFQLVEELSVHRATFQFLCLDSHSHAPATSETIYKCRI